MCRLAAFAPFTSKKQALTILLDFEKGNTDGFGYAFVKNGDIYTYRNPGVLSDALETESDSILDHFPHNGWTIFHLRAASHGDVAIRNTHPFIVNDKAICHNGVWSEYEVAQMLLKRKMDGETDTEVAANTIDLVGYKKFAKTITGAGVFLILNKNGSLNVIKTSGDLEFKKANNNTITIASEFPSGVKSQSKGIGWYSFTKKGKLKKFSEEKPVKIKSWNWKRPKQSKQTQFATQPFLPYQSPTRNYIHQWYGKVN